jgi:glycosyltransferase involved in cell wall biosynthesis
MSNFPKVSVIIPAYKQADYLGVAIESVLGQSYENLEIIVVNDASPDETAAVVARYPDPRLRYLEHTVNQGLPAARNTGLRAATGSILALLDADDLFHGDKVQAHVDFLRANPQIGVSYNARYEINEQGDVLALWRPRLTAQLADMVMGFPFAPSDMVLRRAWGERVDFFDASYRAMSEDLDINCRLALAGCQFGGIDRALNYRRYYPNRVIRNVPDRVQGAERALHTLFNDPARPPQISALRDAAFANLYLVWSYEAFVAELTALGQQWLTQALTLDPSLDGVPAGRFYEFLIDRSLQDGGDHAQALTCVLAQLPAPVQGMKAHLPAMVAEADLRAGLREVLWRRTERGEAFLQRAAAADRKLDSATLQLLVDQLLNLQQMLGDAAAQEALAQLHSKLRPVATRAQRRWLAGCYWLNRGLQSGRMGNQRQAGREIVHAFQADWSTMSNRGAWATLARGLRPA